MTEGRCMETVLYLPQANQKTNKMVPLILAIITVVILANLWNDKRPKGSRRDEYGRKY